MSDVESLKDLEKSGAIDGVEPVHSQQKVAALDGPFARWAKAMASTGMEIEGMDRIQPDNRLQSNGWGQLPFWFSVNLAFSSLGTGWLAAEYFYLDFKTTMIIVWIMNIFGCATQSWIATLGPRYGLRTMALSRYAGGWPGTFVFSLLNILTQLAYSVTTAIAGGQALHAINGSLSLIVGIVVVSVVVFSVTVFGYGLIHHVERYMWIVMFIVYCILYGMLPKGDIDVDVLTPDMDVGRAKIADVLSFAGIMFSVSSGWTTIAADYNVRLDPKLVPEWRTFFCTFWGTYLPICFTVTLSACFQILTKESYVDALQDNAIGGVAGAIFGPLGGFGKFLLVLCAFSTVAANTPNTYSGALSMQTLHPILMKVPRVFYLILFTAIYLIASIVGRASFGTIASNFASLLSYWTAFFFVIMFMEFTWFRRTNGPLGDINPDEFNDFSKLPPGYACIATILCDIALIVPCMSETYYIGPLALAVSSPYGADMGFEVSFFGSIIFYGLFRTLEIKFFKR